MQVNKPNFWNTRKNIFIIIFFPISLLIKIYVFFKKKITISKKFPVPIICVGNIYIGGTGKTPLSILIANELSQKGKKTAIIKKFYSNHIDEHHLTKKVFFKCNFKK